MNDKTTNVPAVVDDGFNKSNQEDRLIRGIIVRCVDGLWKDSDNNPIPSESRWVAWAASECLRQWKNKLPVKTLVKKPGIPLPDLDELNTEIPQREWETGIDGKPRPPWVRQRIVYLLNTESGAELTFISGTTGAAIATEALRNKTANMRMLRGARVMPIVTLSNKLMQTNFGSRLRPEFQIEEWRELGAPSPAIANTEVGKKIAPPSLREEMNDEVPSFNDAVDDIVG
jgi:hypothetical protein